MYLVDYDIPASLRHSFYYDLKKSLARKILGGGKLRSLKDAFETIKLQGIYIKSTQSVVLVDDKDIAVLIYRVANKYGVANLYVVEKMESFTGVNNNNLGKSLFGEEK